MSQDDPSRSDVRTFASRLPRPLEHWLVLFSGQPASDGWKPSARYRAGATVLLAVVGVGATSGVWAERGIWAALASALFWIGFGWIAARGLPADFHRRHPYLDAAVSIPLAALLVLVLLPKSWPPGLLVVIALAYVALIFGGALRGVRRRRETSPARQ